MQFPRISWCVRSACIKCILPQCRLSNCSGVQCMWVCESVKVCHKAVPTLWQLVDDLQFASIYSNERIDEQIGFFIILNNWSATLRTDLWLDQWRQANKCEINFAIFIFLLCLPTLKDDESVDCLQFQYMLYSVCTALSVGCPLRQLVPCFLRVYILNNELLPEASGLIECQIRQ